jgi:hypothetical protein
MNWTCLVYGTPMLFCIVWWNLSAKKWFKGPVVNVEHRMLGAEGNIIEGGEINEISGSDSDSLGKAKRDLQ